VINIGPGLCYLAQKEQLNSLKYKCLAECVVARPLYHRIASLVHAIILKLWGNLGRSMSMLTKNFQVN
jgi:hypothetical protein